MLCDSLVHITNVRFNKEVALNFCPKKSVLLYNKKKIIADRNKWCSQSVWATVWACMCFALSSDAILNIFTNKIVIIRDKNNHSLTTAIAICILKHSNWVMLIFI